VRHHEFSGVINRPIEEVWAFVTDHFNLPRLGRSLLGIRWTSPGPIGVGTTFEERVVIFGSERRITGAVVEWDPPHAAGLTLTGAGFRTVSVRLTLEATADGTNVVRSSEVDPRPAFGLLYWIVGPFLRRRGKAAFLKMKRLLEAGHG